MNYAYQLDQTPIDYSTAPSSSNYINNTSFWNTNTRSTPNQSTATTTPTGNASNSANFHHQSLGNNSTVPSHYNQINNTTPTDTEERLKLKLRIKENEIETLENENQRLHESLALIEKQQRSLQLPLSSTQQRTGGTAPQTQQVVPSTLNEIFMRLSTNYNKAVQELNDNKQRLESLITAYTLNPTNSITNNGRYDELEVSHKILIKLEGLKNENEELLKQLSFGKMKQLDMSFNLVKDENDQLKKENAELAAKLRAYEQQKLEKNESADEAFPSYML